MAEIELKEFDIKGSTVENVNVAENETSVLEQTVELPAPSVSDEAKRDETEGSVTTQEELPPPSGPAKTERLVVYPHEEKDYTFKVLVVGDSGVGKTSLLRRYSRNVYEENYQVTIGIDTFSKVIERDGRKITYRLYDIGEMADTSLYSVEERLVSVWAHERPHTGKTMEDVRQDFTRRFHGLASQERTRLVTRSFYKNAYAALVCYDITREKTLKGALSWKKTIDELVTLPDGSDLPAFLVATKVDLRKEEQDSEDVLKLARLVDRHKFVNLIETSAKENIGVEHTFRRLTDEVLKHSFLIEDKLAEASSKAGCSFTLKNLRENMSKCSC